MTRFEWHTYVPGGVLVPFKATGWRYLLTSLSDATSYSAPEADDSEWAVGQAAFGGGGAGGSRLPWPPATPWEPDGRIWLRRTIPEAAAYAVHGYAEDTVTVWWNGIQIGTHTNGDAMPQVPFTFTVPAAAIVPGPQTLALRASDEPGGTAPDDAAFVDVQVAAVGAWLPYDQRTQALLDFDATIGGPESSITLRLAAEIAPHAPELGERFRITLTDAARTDLGLDPDDAPRFTGEVTDSVSDGTRHNITGVGRWAKHGRTTLDLTGAPIEDDAARIARILAATPSAEDIGIIDAGTSDLLPHPEPAAASTLANAVVESTGGRLVEQRTGALDWHDAEHRRDTLTPALTLTAAEVLGPGFTWAKRVGDLVNDAVIGYGTGDKAVQVTDGASSDARGPYPATLATVLVDESAAYSLGALLVSRRAEPAWQLPAVQVDLMRTILDDERRAILAALRVGERITLTGLPPSPDPAALTTLDLYVESIQERAWRTPGTHETPARDQWRLILTVSDPARSGITFRWIDVDDTLTWADVNPALTWLDLGRMETPEGLGDPDTAPDNLDGGPPTAPPVWTRVVDGGAPDTTEWTDYIDGGTP